MGGYFRRLLSLCEIKRKNNTELTLNTDFIEPALTACSNKNLLGIINKVKNTLDSKISQLNQRKLRKGSQGSAEVGDFLLLQTCLRHVHTFTHFTSLQALHPERLYLAMANLLGDITPFGDKNFDSYTPCYKHGELQESFDSVLLPIQDILSGAHDQHAQQIPLIEKQFGIHVALISDQLLLKNAYFVLAVYADTPSDQIKKLLPATIKIGPVEQLRDLVNLNLPGVRLNALQQGPRALPYYADHTYFQLETKGSAAWKQLESSQTLALHYAGDLPGIRFELWAIRKESEVLL